MSKIRTAINLCMVPFATAALNAGPTTTVSPTDAGKALINPGMGWTMHFYSNVPRNYGSQLEPSDTLDDFPGVSTVYLRLPWAYLEPEEGMYTGCATNSPEIRNQQLKKPDKDSL